MYQTSISTLELSTVGDKLYLIQVVVNQRVKVFASTVYLREGFFSSEILILQLEYYNPLEFKVTQ